MQVDSSNQKIYASNSNGEIYLIDYQIEEDSYEVNAKKIFTHSVVALNKII